MKVQLINHTPQPERTVAAAARLCYSSVGAEAILENLSREEEIKLLKKLISLGHLSPLEHASFTFAVEGVSRALSHQLVRHRIASYSQKSQRYVGERQFSYIIPPTIQHNPEALAQFTQAMEELARVYEQLLSTVPKEDARYVLPAACETKLVFTFNGRSLLNFFAHRLCRRAQWEIRKMACLMLEQVQAVAPVLFQNAGPSCETHGVCYEGSLSCGRAPVIKERFSGDNY